MKFSLARWQFAVAVAAGIAFSSSLEAAQPRTASGSPMSTVRAARFQADDDFPLDDAPEARPSARPAPPARAQPAAPAPARPGRIADEVILEGQGRPHPGVSFADMHFSGESCFGGACRPCQTGPMWAKADYILWWRSGQDLPPLVTTSPLGTPLPIAAEFGRPTTSVLFGNEEESYPVRPGGRVELGWWLDKCETFGVGGRFFWLGNADLNYNVASDGSFILGIPFTEGEDGQLEARMLGYPGTFSGGLDFNATSEVFGGDAYGRMLWCHTDWGRVDLLAGYQFARLNEGLVMDSIAFDQGGASNRLVDSFQTRNEFHGAQIGVTAHIDRCSHYIDLMARVGLGNMSQSVDIAGQSISTVGATQSVIPNSGLFAQPTNVGSYTRDEFVAIPEFGATLGWCITDCIDISFGYTLIVFSNIVRPGDVIDTTVNTTQVGGPLVGPARPAFEFDTSTMVLHGLNMGVTVKW